MKRLIQIDFWQARPECLCTPIDSAASQNKSTLLHFCSFHARVEQGNATVRRFGNSLVTGVRSGGLAESVARQGCEVTEPHFDVLCHASCGQRCGSSSGSSGSSVVRARGSVVLTRLLVLLLLVALQAQDAQAAPR